MTGVPFLKGHLKGTYLVVVKYKVTFQLIYFNKITHKIITGDTSNNINLCIKRRIITK